MIKLNSNGSQIGGKFDRIEVRGKNVTIKDVTWDSNPTLGDPFFDSIGKDYRIKTQSIISAIDFDEFIPFVIGRWNDATIEHEYIEIIIEEIIRNWNGELPK